MDVGCPFWKVFGHLVFLHSYFQVRFCSDFWVCISMSAIRNKAFGMEVLQKTTFTEAEFLMIPGSTFLIFKWLRDQISFLLLP